MSCLHGQTLEEKKEKYPSDFSFVGQYILKNNFLGKNSYLTQNDSLYSSLTVGDGWTLGGILRKNFEERFALEYGLLYTNRLFEAEMGFIERDLKYASSFRFITYALPVTGLVFVKMSPEIFANVGLGLAGSYKTSNVEVVGNPEDNHQFLLGGLAAPKFGLDMNGQVGFEYRTRNQGTFYLGTSMRVGLSPLMYYISTYRKEGNSAQHTQSVQSNYFSVELRWYLPNIKNKGPQPKQGPITQ